MINSLYHFYHSILLFDTTKAWSFDNFLKSLLLIPTLWITVSSNSLAQSQDGIIRISAQASTIYRIDPQTTYLEDSTRNLSFEQVLNLDKEGKFQHTTSKGLSFSFTYSAFWTKFTLESDTQTNWLMEFTYPLVDHIDIYTKDSLGKWQKESYGDLLNFSQRPFAYHNITIPLSLKPGKAQTFYIRMQTESSSLLPILVQTEKAFYEKIIDDQIRYGLQFGMVAIMILYNFFVFFVTRDKNYLLYVIAIFGNLSIVFSVSGHMFQYVFPTLPVLAGQYLLFSLNLSSTANNFFALSFLNTKKYSVILYYVQWFFAVVGILLMLSSFFTTYLFGARWAVLLSIATTYATLITSIWCWVRGNRNAVFFTIAWVSYLLGIQIVAFKNLGFLPVNYFTSHAAEIGNVLEVVLLSFAVGDRYRRMRLAKEKAQAETLQAQKELNETLEDKVKQRTMELSEALEEINQINEELKITLDVSEEQKLLIIQKNESILASIQYAERIQHAILATPQKFKEVFQDSFVLFKPKDIVSGDFYFLHTEIIHDDYELIFLAAADCTGHGVPGALMSMLGNDLLHEIISQSHIYSPELILQELHIRIRSKLKQTENDVRDGMDIALVAIDPQKQILEFTGAKRPLLYIQNGQLKFVKGDKHSIGGEQKEKKRLFTKHQFALIGEEKIDSIYMFSDGYTDQFGGENNTKFNSKQLRELLQKTHMSPFDTQWDILNTTIEDWREKGDESQIDDILVVGAKLS